MSDEPEQAQTNTSIIVAYIKRVSEPNTILFADDQKKDVIDGLFKDPFASKTKLEFDIDHELRENECWEVPLSDAAREALKRQYVLSLDTARELKPNKQEKESNNDIRTIYHIDERKVIFKHIPRSKYLHDSTIISLGDEPRVTDMRDALAIGPDVHAVYNIITNRFYFSDFQAAKHVFGRLEVVYRHATQKDVDEWLDPGLFNVDDNFDTFSISTPNRKKMQYASQSLQVDLEDQAVLDRLSTYAIRNGPGGLFENSRFNIRSNADVSEALRLITGAYFQNEITGDLMIARSATKAKKQQAPNSDPGAIA